MWATHEKHRVQEEELARMNTPSEDGKGDEEDVNPYAEVEERDSNPFAEEAKAPEVPKQVSTGSFASSE